MRSAIPTVEFGSRKRCPETKASPIPFCMTEAALDDLCASVGTLPPESGAKLFGPADTFGVDVVEFDKKGSAGASSGVYAPDVEWSNARAAHHLDAETIRVWTGDCHSHPGGIFRPSSKAGPALGDLGYAEEVLHLNPSMQLFAIPIIVGSGTGRIEIWPWVCEREGDGLVLALAEFEVREPKNFPARPFNPAWEADKDSSPAIETFFDVVGLSRLLHLPVTVLPRMATAFQIGSGDITADITLSASFPRTAPKVRLRVKGQTVPFRFSWNGGASGSCTEERLAKLIRRALRTGKEAF